MKTDKDKPISGTNVHPDLVPSIAGWISPLFQVKANRVVNRYIISEWKTKLEASERVATQLLFSFQQSQFALQSTEEHNMQLQTEVEVKNTLLNMKTEAADTLEEAVCEKTRE